MKFGLLLIGSTIFLLSGVANADQSEHHPRHHLALFAGGGFERDEMGHEENGSTLGIKYDLQFSEKWSVGLAVEYLSGSGTHRSWVAAVPLSYHLNEKWRLFAGPGLEFASNADKFLMRVGIAYEIPFHQRWTASPEILVDLIEGGARTYALGFSIGYGF